MSVATETLTGRDRAILRAVAAGHAELGAGSVLYVDGRYCSEEFGALFNQYKETLDPEQRAAMAIQLNDILINDVAIIPLINRFTPNGKAKTLVGPTHNTFASDLWNIHEWRRTS